MICASYGLILISGDKRRKTIDDVFFETTAASRYNQEAAVLISLCHGRIRLFCQDLSLWWVDFSFVWAENHQPVYAEEDGAEAGTPVHDLSPAQGWVGAGVESVKECAQVSQNARIVNRTEGLHGDPTAEVERHGYEDREIEGENADAGPERTIIWDERNQYFHEAQRLDMIQ